MNRASERAAELAKKRKALETKILTATVNESNVLREKDTAWNHYETLSKRELEAREHRKALADELAELSKD